GSRTPSGRSRASRAMARSLGGDQPASWTFRGSQRSRGESTPAPPRAAIGAAAKPGGSATGSDYLPDCRYGFGAAFHLEVRNRNGQAEASGTCTPRIDELHAVAVGNRRFVRVSGNDDVKTGSQRVDLQLLHIVKDVDADALDLEGQG